MTTADRMAVMDQGVVQQVGTPIELFDDPVNPFVAQFVGTMNLLPGRVRERRGDALTLAVDGVGDLDLPLRAGAPPGETLMLSFRPHSLRMDAGRARRSDARCIVAAPAPWRPVNSSASSRATACAWARTAWPSTTRTAPAAPRSRWATR